VICGSSLNAQNRKYELSNETAIQSISSEYVVVKLKKPVSSSTSGRSFSPSDHEYVTFLPHLSRKTKKNNARLADHPLGKLYKVKLRAGEKPLEVINDLLKNEEVIYAEPYFNHKPLFIPSDPDAQPGGNQWYLTNIRAYDAWTIERGDSSIIIGSLDSGILPDHYDLQENVYINQDDPINGLDDDEDGLVDNRIGWDIADGDNNIIADTDIHGHGVAGVSSASTNNGLALAGTGFNSKVMPIKTFASGSDAFRNGYEGIALAADLGCSVLNLSWGSAGSFSQYGQDIINYAVEEKDVVIVAAAGNTNALLDFYPASFDNVLSVGATNIGDQKADFATYSYKIDLMAPGDDIYVMDGDSLFSIKKGTSYSSPMVAGAAALIRARFPNLTAEQVMERIRVNADDIYSIAGNDVYGGQLGKGRLNMLAALTNTTNPSLRIDSMAFNNGVGPYIFYDDTLSLGIKVKNYLLGTDNAIVTLSSNSPYVEILEDSYSLGELQTLATGNNFDSPFRVKLDSDLPPNEELIFRVDFKDGSYEDFEYFILQSDPGYVNVDNSKLALTVNNEGSLGYDQDGFEEGVGITWQGEKILDNIGFVVANHPDSVKDNFANILSLNARDHDFIGKDSIRYFTNGVAPIDARNTFIDDPNASNPLNVIIEQKTLASDHPNNEDFIIIEYRLTNISGQNIEELHTGLFADWNLSNPDFNQADWDGANLTGYVRDAESTVYSGIALLSSHTPFYNALNNKNANGNSTDLPSTITDNDKYNLISNGIDQTMAGEIGGGNDVSHVIGYSFNNFTFNSSHKYAFAVVVGNSLAELQDAASNAADFYSSYLDTPPLAAVVETCPGDIAEINPSDGDTFGFYSDRELTNELAVASTYITGAINTPETYYIVNKDNAFDGDVRRVVVRPKTVNADFSISANPLLLDESGNTSVQFDDESIDGVSWSWDFDNGFSASSQNPLITFPETGSYNISLTVTSDLGCTEMVSRTLEVANRSNKPNVVGSTICKGEELLFDPTNATAIEVYSDLELDNMVASGSEFQTGQLYSDTTFYMISVDSAYASNPKEVNVQMSSVESRFSYSIDTTDLSTVRKLHFRNESIDEELFLWYDENGLLANSNDLEYEYSENEFTIELIAEDINCCRDSLKQTFLPKISPAPEVTDSVELCVGETLSYIPTAGKLFAFYSDQTGSNLLKKGRSIDFQNVQSDSTIYVGSIDSLLLSELIPLTLDVSEIKADFLLSTDSLDIGEVNTLTITNESIEADQYQWLINDEDAGTEVLPNFEFGNVGTFEVNLIASNVIGCIDSTTQALKITNISSTEFVTDAVIIYPNPTTSELIIKSNTTLRYKLLDLNGRELQSGTIINNSSLDFRSLPEGIYLLEFIDGERKLLKRVVKE